MKNTHISVVIENNVYSSDELFQRSREGLFWSLFQELRSNEGNKHQNNTRVSAETVHHVSTYIILFPTTHNESINDDKNDDLYTSPPCLTQFSFCWWRHNQLLMMSQWPDNCEAITWIMISNSLDIDFIRDDIHGRSRTNFFLLHQSVVNSRNTLTHSFQCCSTGTEVNVWLCRCQRSYPETYAWWRHQMEAFPALLALCEGNPRVTGGFPSQRPVKPEQKVEQTIETPVIWDTIALIMML